MTDETITIVTKETLQTALRQLCKQTGAKSATVTADATSFSMTLHYRDQP